MHRELDIRVSLNIGNVWLHPPMDKEADIRRTQLQKILDYQAKKLAGVLEEILNDLLGGIFNDLG